MRLAILGTKGIPNHYGGFEQFAEYLSLGLTERGHEVTVYAPHFHSFKGKEIKKVKIKHFYCPERYLGGAAHYLYDHLCLKDAVKDNFDIIYEAGYASCAFAIRHFKGKMKTPIIVTNMDGMEWKRSKWNAFVQYVTRRSERIAVQHSDFLIADNPGIKKYYEKEYSANPVFLPYGAELVNHFDLTLLEKYSLKPREYFLLIARLEPENNIETVIRSFIKSQSPFPLIIIGGLSTKHASKLLQYSRQNPNVIFVGGLYDICLLNNLRHFSRAYLHGHSVGGTNPSLLEAMACSSYIIAHENEFNRSVLEGNGSFFRNEADLHQIFTNLDQALGLNEKQFKKKNLELIKTKYEWSLVIDAHEKFFESIITHKKCDRK